LTGQSLEKLRKANFEKILAKAPFTPDIPMPETWPDAQKKRYGEIGKSMSAFSHMKRVSVPASWLHP
jgi:hypothetical protein